MRSNECYISKHNEKFWNNSEKSILFEGIDRRFIFIICYKNNQDIFALPQLEKTDKLTPKKRLKMPPENDKKVGSLGMDY